VGLAVALFFECFSPLVQGARYEIVVHWKTTLPQGVRVPDKLHVDEVVSEPVVFTHLVGVKRPKEGSTSGEGNDGSSNRR
jgi:hypothetical protein